MRKISNYIEIIGYKKDSYILYNKINGTIVQVSLDSIKEVNDSYFFDKLSLEDELFLEKNDFFISDSVAQSIILKYNIPFVSKQTSIVLSVTEQCNLNCDYCYQQSWNKKEALEDEKYLTLAINYLREIIPKLKLLNSKLNIYFMGGEPLLKKTLIYNLLNEINSNWSNDIDIDYFIDTNLTLISRDFICQFPNLTVYTTITNKRDHDKYRSNSFDTVIHNLTIIKDLFDNKKYKIVIRYNANNNNIAEVEELLSLLEKLNFKWSIDIQNIMNTSTSTFKNNMSDLQFANYYTHNIIPILINHDCAVELLPQTGLIRQCRGINPFCMKLYSNGSVTMCDYFQKGSFLENLRTNLSPLPEICIKCYDFPYCGGQKPCEEKCDGNYKFKSVMRERILEYVRQHERAND